MSTAAERALVGVVIPIRSFIDAKARLAVDLPGATRGAFVQLLAERVVAAAGRLPVVIVTQSPEVAIWAEKQGLTVVVDSGGGLSEAATLGRDFFADQGFERVIVAHGDLPFCEELSSLGFDQPAARVLLAPCHRTDGTNICSVPARAAFEFSYGPGSFARHKAEVERLGLELEVVTRDDLAFDVDTPEDLATYNARKSS